MTIEGIENQKLTANLRVINTFITVLSIILSIWMALGDSVMSPLCDLPVFVDRRESCFRNGVLEMRDRFSVIILFLVTAAAAIFVRSDKAVKKLLEQKSTAQIIQGDKGDPYEYKKEGGYYCSKFDGITCWKIQSPFLSIFLS